MLIERLLFKLFSAARRSKFGALLVVVGVAFMFALVVLNLVSIAGNVILMATSAGPVVEYLETGQGVLVGFGVSVVVILCGLSMMLFIRSDSALGDAEVAFEPERDVEARLQQSEQGRRTVQAERDALKEELERVRPSPNTGGTEAPTIEEPPLQEDREIRELEIQERWRAEDALEAYLNQMQQWLGSKDQPLSASSYEDPRRKMARTRTLTILRRLDPRGKRDVLQFLQEHGLIKAEDPVIRLSSADLSGANLVRMNLTETNLSGANLSGADLSRAR